MQDRHLRSPLLFPWPRSALPTFFILESPLSWSAAFFFHIIYEPKERLADTSSTWAQFTNENIFLENNTQK